MPGDAGRSEAGQSGSRPARKRQSARRRRIEASLAGLVSRNRFTIAVVFPTVGAATLLASAAGLLPPLLAFNPLLVLGGTAVMRLPLAAGLAPILDRRAAASLALLAAYTYAVELVGVTTGLPYGDFSYGVALGPMLGGVVPLALPLFFVPLAVDGYLLADRVRLTRGWPAWTRPMGAVAAVVAIDLVLDPAAVALGLWSYAAGGPVYDVPLSNFGGWLLSAAVAVALLEVAVDGEVLAARARQCPFLLDDLVSFALLWGVVAGATGRWASVGVALSLFLVLASTGYLRRPRPDAG
jgi:putative membrane protein